MPRVDPPDPLGRPPGDFNPEWARFCVDYAAARRGRPMFENIASWVAIVSSVIALGVSGFNLYFMREDRAEQGRKEALAGQISLAKLYFDRSPSAEPCGPSRDDKQLFAKTAVTIAGFDYDNLQKAYFVDTRMTSIRIEEDKRALQGLALVLFVDIYSQIRSCEDAKLKGPETPTGQQLVRIDTPTEGSTYDLRQQTALPQAQAPASAAKPRVFIQIKKGDPGAAQRAATLQAYLRSQGYAVPGVEAVNNAPSVDQIRIYKGADEPEAAKLKGAAGILDPGTTQIIDLSKAYPKLPGGIWEIWLASRSS